MPIDNAGFQVKSVPQCVQNLNASINAIRAELSEKLAEAARKLLTGKTSQHEFDALSAEARKVMQLLESAAQNAQNLFGLMDGITPIIIGPTARGADDRMRTAESEQDFVFSSSGKPLDYDCVRNDAC